jgi:predicted acetyltransferase
MDIEEHVYRRPDLPRLIEQQVLDFGRIVWADGFRAEDRFRDRLHEVPDDTTHFVRAAGSLLVSHVQVIPIDVEGRHERLVVGGVSSVMTYPNFRGEGHAGALLRRAAEHIASTRMDVGMLFCDQTNVPFYERLGWETLDAGRVVVAGHADSEDRAMVLGGEHLLPDVVNLPWSW